MITSQLADTLSKVVMMAEEITKVREGLASIKKQARVPPPGSENFEPQLPVQDGGIGLEGTGPESVAPHPAKAAVECVSDTTVLIEEVMSRAGCADP